jgi:DNA-directed RNA polymerase specialized sigma24 family protein
MESGIAPLERFRTFQSHEAGFFILCIKEYNLGMNGDNSRRGQIAEAGRQIGDQDHDPLEDIVRREDVSALLQHEMRTWPRAEREVFELYYLEGREPEEIEMLTDYPLDQIKGDLMSVRQKLQTFLVAA